MTIGNWAKGAAAGWAVLALLAMARTALAVDGTPGQLTIHVDKPGAKIRPTLFGLMTEEINYSYEGGLYGELIWDRNFRDVGRGGVPTGWSFFAGAGGMGKGTIAMDETDPVNKTGMSNSLRVDIADAGGGGAGPDGMGAGVANAGFWGIPVEPNWQYKCSFYARVGNGFSGPLTVAIVGSNGKVIASEKVDGVGAQWGRHQVTLKTGAVAETAQTQFVIMGANKGSVWLSLVSLFPPTFHDRPNGFRTDLMQLLDEMHPAFLRFPGGNYLEGPDFANRFNWKATVGPYEERVGHRSPWNYRSTDGMGLLEFLEWCEDLKMQPVLAVYDGLHIDRGAQILTGDQLKPHVQDALDEIEYVTGPATSEWGAKRAKDGHPEPFSLAYVEIGNEDNLNNGGPTYDGRFTLFYDAIKAKYPELKLIASAPRLVRTRTPDAVDEHYYMSIDAALHNAHMYDNRPRTGPKIFVGEWATRVGDPTPQLSAAIADAAFLTGLERNADLIVMSCYAPLLVNVNPGGQQWATDLIGYDTLHSFGSPSYYVQKMFNGNRGDVVIPVEVKPQIVTPVPPAPLPPPPPPASTATTTRGGGRGGRGRGPQPPADTLFASASRDLTSGEVIVKVVNAANDAQRMTISLEGVKAVAPEAGADVLQGAPADVNTIADPMHVAPQHVTMAMTGGGGGASFNHEFPANSVTVVRLKVKE